MKILFKGGLIVSAESTIAADLLVEEERVAAVGAGLSGAGAEVVDAGGCYLLPGAIDVHTHLDMPLEIPPVTLSTADDFYSGHVAAAFGGTTAHLDFAIQPKGQSLRAALDLWHDRAAGKAVIDYGFHMTIADPTPEVLREIALLPGWGIPTVKVLMAYKGRLQVDDATLFAILREAAPRGILTMVHCENGDVIELLIAEAAAAGRLSPRDHALTRPAELEGEATGRAVALAALAGAPLYVVHLTCEPALRQVQSARARGLPVWAETCVQYLFFTAEELDRPGFEGAKFVCSPPFRTAADRKALWRALADGTLAAVSTDHAPFAFATQKTLGREDFRRIPNGVPAIEERVLLLHHAGVGGGRLSLSRLVDLVATTPARLFGLYPRKGTLEVGADADIVLFDPQAERTLSVRTHHSRVDYNLFEGMHIRGAPRGVWRRGRRLVEGDRFLGEPGTGAFLHRAPFQFAAP